MMDHNQNNNVEFLPGFSFCEGTRPGKKITREKFSVSFHSVLVGYHKTMISQGFECCYEWTPIMNIFLDLLNASKALEDLDKVEFDIKDALSAWFLTYPGWGLFSSLLRRETQIKLTRGLQRVKRTLRDIGESHSDETCWKILTQDLDSFHISVLADLIPNSSIADLLPNICMVDLLPNTAVTLMEGDFGGEAGRRKGLVLRLGGKWNLDIQFVVEKLAKQSVTLLDISLDAVASSIKGGDEIDLVMPASLYKPLWEACQDRRWREGKGE